MGCSSCGKRYRRRTTTAQRNQSIKRQSIPRPQIRRNQFIRGVYSPDTNQDVNTSDDQNGTTENASED